MSIPRTPVPSSKTTRDVSEFIATHELATKAQKPKRIISTSHSIERMATDTQSISTTSVSTTTDPMNQMLVMMQKMLEQQNKTIAEERSMRMAIEKNVEEREKRMIDLLESMRVGNLSKAEISTPGLVSVNIQPTWTEESKEEGKGSIESPYTPSFVTSPPNIKIESIPPIPTSPYAHISTPISSGIPYTIPPGTNTIFIPSTPSIPRVKPPTFSGEDNEDIMGFIMDFERVININGWSRSDTLKAIEQSLRKDAAFWYSELSMSKRQDWDDIKASLIKNYIVADQTEIGSQIARCKQKHGESVKDYYSRLVRLLKQLEVFGIVSNDRKVSSFLDGILEPIRLFYRWYSKNKGPPTTLNDALEDAREVEASVIHFYLRQ